MNQTHIHLLITHLPIFGSMLGVIVLAFALRVKSAPTIVAACLIFIISGTGGGIAYLTGEAAEETAENITGINESLIEEHEDAAVFALTALIVVGIASLACIYIIYKYPGHTSIASKLLLILSITAFLICARTGYLGGQIRHTEISNNSAVQLTAPEMEEHD
jgi:hypothetical protein